MLVGAFAFTAGSRSEDGFSFPKNSVYMTKNDFDKVPQTIEATVWLNKRVPIDTKGGSIFGNYRGHRAFPDMNITVEPISAGGHPEHSRGILHENAPTGMTSGGAHP